MPAARTRSPLNSRTSPCFWGGRAGANLCGRPAVTTGKDTLLRLLRALPVPAPESVPCLGVDEFAVRRGRTYATILVDMTTRRPVDVLADRTAHTFADWLRKHPEVRVVCRDRAGSFRDGAHAGAPQARQVADGRSLSWTCATCRGRIWLEIPPRAWWRSWICTPRIVRPVHPIGDGQGISGSGLSAGCSRKSTDSESGSLGRIRKYRPACLPVVARHSSQRGRQDFADRLCTPHPRHPGCRHGGRDSPGTGRAARPHRDRHGARDRLDSTAPPGPVRVPPLHSNPPGPPHQVAR